MKSESDVFGQEDLTDLLSKHPEVERRHYKLWINSASTLQIILNQGIIGRSESWLEDAIESSARYAITNNHKYAVDKLSSNGVLIVTGEPGVGKTTLADQVCLNFVAEGYSLFRISDSVKEAEAVFKIKEKQIFYFDDFLGSNYLNALKNSDTDGVISFMRRVSRDNRKKFILTSRTAVLNQGRHLSDRFGHNNIEKNEYELRIDSFSGLDKAHILYNHIWRGRLNREHTEELYRDKRYKLIIRHANFNPRIISYITDESRFSNLDTRSYWPYVMDSLNDPKQIWNHPFDVQLDDCGRALILLTTLHGGSIPESTAEKAFIRYIELSTGITGKRDFQINLKHLVGAFLNRSLDNNGRATLDLFNPSIADFVIHRYKNDANSICRGIFSFSETTPPLDTIARLRQSDTISKFHFSSICESIIRTHSEQCFLQTNRRYISLLCRIFVERGQVGSDSHNLLKKCASYICEHPAQANAAALAFVNWLLSEKVVDVDFALTYIRSSIEELSADEELDLLGTILNSINPDQTGVSEVIAMASDHVLELVSDFPDDFVVVSDCFNKIGYGDYAGARESVVDSLFEKICSFGIHIERDDIVPIVLSMDIVEALDSFFEESDDSDDEVRSTGIRNSGISIEDEDEEIDELFDKSGRI